MLNVCLIGAGGVGTIAAYVLEKSQRCRVTAVLRSNYAVVKEQGFDIDSVDHGEVRGWKPHRIIPSLSHAATEPDQPYDFIVITTKAIPELTASLIPDLKRLITPRKTSLVLIQNGLDIEKSLASAFPETPILSGLSMIGVRTTSPRTVLHEDPDQLRIGAYWHHFDGPGPTPLPRQTQLDAALLFVEVYNAGLSHAKTTRKSGAECVLADDIIAARWRKLLWNGSFNTLCTLLRMSVGELLSSPTGRKTLLEPAMREIAAIATAAGYGDAVSEDVVQLMLHDTPETSPFRPSMLVDLEKGRPLELDVILGAPLAVAMEKGVSTPVLSQVYELLKVVQWHLLRQTQTHSGKEPIPTNGT
jgi:2-dehydropantoate 2-reductase